MSSTNYTQPVPSDGVKINFYGGIPCLLIPERELPLSVEEICEKAANHVVSQLPSFSDDEDTASGDSSHRMASLTLPMFSLINHEHNQWMTMREKLTRHDILYEFFFRIRFRFYNANLSDLEKLDRQTWEYLFWQFHDDFVSDRFSTMYNKNLERPKVLGFVVMGYFIPKLCTMVQNSPARGGKYHPLQSNNGHPRVTVCGLKKHLPERERLNFKWPWPYYRLYRSVKEEVGKFASAHGNIGVERYMHTYMNGVLEEVAKYGSECYHAIELLQTNPERTQPVDIVVDPFCSKPPGIYFHMQFVCTFQDIENLVLATSSDPAFGVEVRLIRRNGALKMLRFRESKMAESFVSCVDGYCRLLHNFYDSIATQVLVEPPSLTQLKELKAFGPMLRKDAESKMQKELSAFEDDLNQREVCFLIYQSVHSLTEFWVMKQSRKEESASHLRLSYNRRNQKFTLYRDIGDLIFHTPGDLLMHFRKQANMIRPKTECSISELYRSDEIDYYCSTNTPATGSTVRKGPTLFGVDICKEDFSIVGRGRFTQVLEGMLYDDDKDEKVTIKELKLGEGHKSEDFQKGVWKLMQLEHHKTFVKLHGVLMAPPFRVILEHAPLGDLLTLMGQSPMQFSLTQIISVVEQLTQGLKAMEEKQIFHGNLRCRNILVMNVTALDLLVRISDPGMEAHYVSNAISDEQNIERLPWVAVERFDNLRKLDSASEIYSFAMTWWEMLSKGTHPNKAINLPADASWKNFFKEGGRPPRPEIVTVTEDDPAPDCKDGIWKYIELCWDSDPENRPSVKDISRKVYELCDQVREQEQDLDIPSWEQVVKQWKEQVHQNQSPEESVPVTDTGDTVIHSERLEVDETDKGKLGAGYYGTVRKAKLYETTCNKSQKPVNFKFVAVKELKKFSSASEKIDFVQEIHLASKLSHKNIVKIEGVCSSPKQLLVMEFVERGALNTYLHSLRNSSPNPITLCNFTVDVAEGMKYLHSKKIVHRDLAARNILLTQEKTAKITDFGLSRLLKDKNYYKGSMEKPLPVHWCSPEAIGQRRFSTKGDVWSYGILLWEIFSLGKKPHLVESDEKIIMQELFLSMKRNKRLEEPSHCVEGFYQLMKDKCWQFDPQARPDFDEIVTMVYQLRRNCDNNGRRLS
ncbi:tyrosine-protein kinase JAK2-like isoform X1 [Haliotis rufescens]|uniref:tyrosine-protein kinase JAK2-like isoform X1 n=1 Tax=Haliotis rufescens TaxID=6454 RepID=UPI00201F80C0|nr:tyrosine-protein kinase JAK2-like isoform X1 [Haliotis rufescens]